MGVAPSASITRPSAKVMVPPSPAWTRVVRNCSTTSSRPGSLVVGRECVEQPGGATGQRASLGQVGHQGGQVGDVEDAVLVVVARDEADRPGGGVERLEVADEDRVWAARGDVHHGDVEAGTALEPERAGIGRGEQVAQHADDGRDARTGGDGEQALDVGLEDELAGGLVEVDQRAGAGLVDEVVAHRAVGHGLDGDGDAAVTARAVGEGVGAPLADTVDVDPDAEVLARHVAGPVGARPDHDRGGVGGLGMDLLDAATQVGAGAQGGEEVEVVGRQERRRGGLGGAHGAVAQAAATHGRLQGRGHHHQCPANGAQVPLPPT